MARAKNTDSAPESKKIEIEIETDSKSKAAVKSDSTESKEQSSKSKSKANTVADSKNEAKASADDKSSKVVDKQADEEKKSSEKSPQDELSAEKDRYLRLAAEYDNFRKRSARERETIYNDSRADTIGKLLPVYDNLERALKMDCSDEAYYKGIEMIMQQLKEILDDLGVSEIDALGEPFDPNKHNAVMKIENTELDENVVAEEYQKGFMLWDKVIRFSTVVVAN